MALGDGIRRNIAHVDPAERALLRDAILEMHRRFFPGNRGDTPPGGVSWWFKQDEIHQATHVHGGPAFLPWHREVVNRFEELLRQISPQLSMHYWDWTEDPTVLFTHDFMGNANGEAGEPWQANTAPFRPDGFYVPGADPFRGGEFDPVHNNPNDPPLTLTRACGGGSFATTAQDDAVTAASTYKNMWSLLESMHNNAHGFIGGTLSDAHVSFRDPFVFLLHSNVDRLVAKWQTDPAHTDRLLPATFYSGLSTSELNQLSVNVEPWSTGVGSFHPIRPWFAPENQGVPHDYYHVSVVSPPCYDTNLSTFHIDEVENPFNAATNRNQVIFNDVPEEETTWRAAIVRVYTCPDTTFRVMPGTEPGVPFGIAVGQATAVQGSHPHAFQDVKIWFQYTAGAVGTAPHIDGPVNTTLTCDETGQQFQFELRANTIHRPTVAVQMVLDQSGSMAWPAGTSGLTRLDVLKDAANLFATVIQDNNGLGIVRFDQDAYPPNDPVFPGMPLTKILSDADRDTAHTAINAHGAHGGTSVGDGLIMGHNQVIALAPGSYDQTAILLLTDGIENAPISISDAIGMGAVDSKVYAIGLGNEFQINTAALNSLSGTSGGNLLLSGVLMNGTDDFFRVKKFFLQILAGLTNTSIVRDPTGYLNVGTQLKIPFQLSEADINCRVILLTDFPVVKLSVEMPDGSVIDEAGAAAFGVTFKGDGHTETASFNLPIAFQAQKIQAGTWNAILEVDPALYKRELIILGDKNPRAADILKAKGARYCVSMHSFSNLRMTATVTQNAYDPGSTLNLRAALKEYNLPIERRVEVLAGIEYPDHTHSIVSLAETQPGVFEAAIVAGIPGIYRFTVAAKGSTSQGVPFTREQILTAAVFHDIHTTPDQPVGSGSKDNLCLLLSCLLSEKNLTPALEEILKKQGINLAGIRNCVKLFCKGSR